MNLPKSQKIFYLYYLNIMKLNKYSKYENFIIDCYRNVT